MSNILTDRYLGESLSLPNSWNDIQIKQNEFAIADNFNAALEKLDFNLQYIEAQTQLAINIIPQGYVGWVGSNPLVLNAGNVDTSLGLANVLSAVIDGAFVEHPTLSGTYFSFSASPSTIVVYQVTPTTVTVKSQTEAIKGVSTFTFDTIGSVLINSENSLYVCDTGASIIYKFDVSNIVSGVSSIQTPTAFLTNVVGGSGTLYDRTRFNGPTKMSRDAFDNLYVLDVGNRGIKIYDKELNWINTLQKINDFKANPFVDVFVDLDTQDIYVLTSTGVIYVYHNSTGDLVTKHTLSDELASGEFYSGIIQSQNDTNVLYILTNLNVIKKFKSKIERSIGRFRLTANHINNEEFTFITTFVDSDDTTVDNIFIGANSKVLRCQESVSYQTVAYTSNKFPLSAVNVQEQEFNDPFVVNKALSKTLYNHLAVKNNLHSRFVGSFNSDGLLEFIGTRYILETDGAIYNYQSTLNQFVGINEIVSTSVINRTLFELYTLETMLLDLCADVQLNTFPLSTQPLLIE